MSTGLAWLQGAGRKPFKDSIVSGGSSAPAGVFCYDVEGLRVTLGVRVAEDVHGVGVAPGGGEETIQGLHRLGGELGQLSTAGDEGVGGEHAGATGVGDYGEARPPAPRPPAEPRRPAA